MRYKNVPSQVVGLLDSTVVRGLGFTPEPSFSDTSMSPQHSLPMRTMTNQTMPTQQQSTSNNPPDSGTVGTLMTIASAAGTALGAYHGYKRNNSIGWGIWWGFMGGAIPYITLPLAVAQGFGEEKYETVQVEN